VTTTDEILALTARRDDGQRGGTATAVTGADLAAFRAAADRGQGSAVVRALRAACPAAALSATPPAAPLDPPAAPLDSPGAHLTSPAAAPCGDPAWTAWLAAAAAVAGEAVAGEAVADADEPPAAAPRPVWCAVLGAAVALAGPPASDPAAAAVYAAAGAGLSAAAIVESGLADWGGWSSGTVAAAVGAAVTAGLLLGLPEGQLRAAIGICATQATGLRAAEGTDAFPLQVGKAAFNGVEAALLARAGLTAPAEPLDGRRGLFALFG
jgi:MmgE/PrpD N-terminal domain